MELRQIRYFLEVVRAGGFHRASATLRIAQPAISVAVRKLEEDLGITLFDREGKKTRLTPEGSAFYRRAVDLEGMLKDIELEMGELRGVERGELRLGLPSMLAAHVFPDVVGAFRRRYPGLRLRIFGGGGVKIAAMLEGDEIELGVIDTSDVTPSLDYLPLVREEMVACVAADHPLAPASSLTPGEFAAQLLFLFEQGYHQREVLETLFRKEGLRPQVALESNHVALLATVTADGGGATTLLRLAAEAAPGLIPISFDPPLYVDAGIAWRRNSYLSVAARAFLEFLKGFDFGGKGG